MDKEIHKFYLNKPMRDAVYGIIRTVIDEKSIDTIKAGEDASGYKKAYESLDATWRRIEKEYNKK